jgi:hypothetical protein
LEEFSKYDFITNSYPLKIIIEFIGSSEVVITSSYHICYWATLMQKRVILHKVFSEKFTFMKYPPVIFSGKLQHDIAKCKIYSGALADSIVLNRNFIDEIRTQFEL